MSDTIEGITAENTELDASLLKGITGEFVVLDAFIVDFVIQPALPPVMPLEWVVSGKILRFKAPHGTVGVFHLGPGHLTQTIKVPAGMPGGYYGTIELKLTEGKDPTFEVTYSLQQAIFPHVVKKGTYTFKWPV